MSENSWARFGAWFQLQRQRTGVSQAKAAKKAGIHVIQLSRIENGRSGVKRETLDRIIEAINSLSVEYKIDASETLDRAGFSATGSNAMHDIGNRAQVKLGAPDLSPADQIEIAEELAFAYEVIMARRKARREKESDL